MPKYFLYARKSTDEEDRQVLSLDSQLNELRAFAKKEHLDMAGEFIESQTAKSPGRPIFNDMLKRMEKGKLRAFWPGTPTGLPATLWTAERLSI
jgi:DNA invertase Pin-like site-specific DNA recombinase